MDWPHLGMGLEPYLSRIMLLRAMLIENALAVVSVCCNHFLCINSLTPPDSPLRWIFCYHPHFTDEQTKPQGAYLPKVTQLVITKIRSKPRQPGSESMHPATAAHCLSVDQTRDD